MTTQVRSTLVIACWFAAACGSSSTNNGNGADAPGSQHDAPAGGHDASTGDASPDGAILPGGVYAIPLSTPTGQDQGEFYTAMLTASGSSFALDIDTGSSDTGIAGSTCSSCTGMSPLYTPGSSATDTGQTDQIEYADQSGWSGEIYTDTVGLQHGSPNVSLNLVEITAQQMNFFSGNEYQGILGLCTDAILSSQTATVFPDVIAAAGVTDIMSVEMCPTDGTLWFGGFDMSHMASAPKYTPLSDSNLFGNDGFYEVNMTGMGFGTKSLGVTTATAGYPIVDTGTSLFYIPSPAETALIADINKDPGYKALFPSQTLTDPTNSQSQTAGCVNAKAGTTDAMVDSMLPPLTETFDGVGGGSITISAPALGSYFYNAGGGQYCLAIFGGGDVQTQGSQKFGGMVMGDVFLRGFVTVIDRANKQVGFAPTSHCAAPTGEIAPHRLRERGRGPHHLVRRAR